MRGCITQLLNDYEFRQVITGGAPVVAQAPSVSATPHVQPASSGSLPARPRSQAKAWAVVVGVSRYQYVSEGAGLTNLAYADDDARAFRDALLNQGWDSDHIKLMVDEGATRREILKALEGWLTKVGPDDLILLYWSGHGFPDPEDPEKVYLACYDTEVQWPATGFRMDRVRDSLSERGASNVVVVADTCHAGKLVTRGNGRGIAAVPYVAKLEREQAIPRGWVFLVSAETDRQAVEHTSWANGAFTHCLLEAMAGKADGYRGAGPRDGVITLGEIKEYLNTAMPDETQRVLGVAKRPLITTSTGDADIWNLTLDAR